MKKDNSLIQNPEVQRIIRLALAEDRVNNDRTSKLIIPPGMQSTAKLLSKETGVLAGIDVFAEVFRLVDPKISVEIHKFDKEKLKYGDVPATVRGNTRSILRAERTALNFICHLSGIASITADFTAQVVNTAATISDTRKTNAGQRLLEKHATFCGGARNHRFDLSDGILIKDNHISALGQLGLSTKDIVARAQKRNLQGSLIEIEVNSVSQAEEAASAGADILLLDNMSLADIRSIVKKLKGTVLLEVSGGVTLQNVKDIAKTGVDTISIGALTHSAKTYDFSLEIS